MFWRQCNVQSANDILHSSCVVSVLCTVISLEFAKLSKFAYDQNTAIHDMLLTNADNTEKVRLRQQTDSRYVQKGHRKAIRE